MNTTLDNLSGFHPRIVPIHGELTCVITPWEAVLALVDIREASREEEQDILTLIQILAVRCALGLIDRQKAHNSVGEHDHPDERYLRDWLELCVDTYLARHRFLDSAHQLLGEARSEV